MAEEHQLVAHLMLIPARSSQIRYETALVQLTVMTADELKRGISAVAGKFGDSDAERAAALWLAQLRHYAAALASYPGVRSLDANTLFDTPRPVLAAAAALFDRPTSDASIDAIVAGPLFAQHSKNPAYLYDNRTRIESRRASAHALAPEVVAATGWVEARLKEYALPQRLMRPLVGSTSPILSE